VFARGLKYKPAREVPR